MLGLAVSFFLLNLANFGLHALWVLYTDHRYGWTSSQVGWSLAVVGITAAIVQGGLARRIIPALGEVRSITVGYLIGAVAFAGYGLATQGWMIYAILVFGSLGGIGSPAAQGLISGNVADNEQGAIQGALTSLGSIAGFTGPLLSTSLFGYFIGPKAPFPLPGAGFFLGAVLILVSLAVALRTIAKHPPKPLTTRPGSAVPPAAAH